MEQSAGRANAFRGDMGWGGRKALFHVVGSGQIDTHLAEDGQLGVQRAQTLLVILGKLSVIVKRERERADQQGAEESTTRPFLRSFLTFPSFSLSSRAFRSASSTTRSTAASLSAALGTALPSRAPCSISISAARLRPNISATSNRRNFSGENSA